MENVISWFEIPVSDIDRATQFYSTILDLKMEFTEIMGVKMSFFPFEPGVVSGSLCQGKGYIPSSTGTLIYFSAGEDLSVVLDRIEDAGGKVIMKKTLISDDNGYMAIFFDTEGNKIALHSPK